MATEVSNEKLISIITYFTFVGWILAFVMNNKEPSKIATFHIRQSLGIFLVVMGASIIMIIPFLGWIVGMVGYLLALVMWLVGILGAFNNEMKLVPVLGGHFQDWFKGL